MKQRREKGKRKTLVCANMKQMSTKCGVILCNVLGNAEKMLTYM